MENLQAYSAPLEGRRGLLRLDFNENTIGPSPKVVEAIRAIPPENYAIYPEYDGLREAMVAALSREVEGMAGDSGAASSGLTPAHIGLFNGVDAAIHAIFHAYGDRGDFIAVIGNTGAARFLPGLARRMGEHVPIKVLPVPNKGHSLPDVRLSDHSPFWDVGYDAVMVTDTSFMRNPHYHRMSDTIDTLDIDFLAAVTEALDNGLRAL